jgi:hypothetical protein
MSSPLKINLEIQAPPNQSEREALSNVIKANGKVLGEAWSTIREIEDDSEAPQKITISLAIELGPDGNHTSTTIKAFSRKFAVRTVKITPAKK